MPLEIEIKLKVPAHDPLRAALQRVGGTYIRTVLETNTFFDRPDRSLRKADTGLRVRTEILEAGQPLARPALLTFKGPRQADALRSREAFDLSVSPAEQLIPLLQGLGFVQMLSFEKRRESWELKDCLVELDTMPEAGLFVEVEGPTEAAVSAVRSLLGLSALLAVEQSYSAMMSQLAAAHPQWNQIVKLR